MTADVIELDRRCNRCRKTYPAARNVGGLPRSICPACRESDELVLHITGVMVDMRLRVAAASALLRLGCVIAAGLVLDGHPMPALAGARAMQRKAAP